MRFALILTALAGSVAALSITSPQKDQVVDLSQKTLVQWTSVSSDPSSFDMYLVKMNSYPSVNQLLVKDVKTSDGSYTLQGVTAANGDGYQINFLSNNPQNTGILAQSQQFNVSSSGSASSTTTTETASSSTASTGKASTTTPDSSTMTTSTMTTSTMTTSASGTASTSSSSGNSTTTKSNSTSTASGTSSHSTGLSSGAGALAVPASALLLSLAVLAL